MKNLFPALSFLLIASCGSAPKVPDLPPVIVYGCTIELETPVCDRQSDRPFFSEGETGKDVAVGYEQVKRDLLKTESCQAATEEAINNWRKACAQEGRKYE